MYTCDGIHEFRIGELSLFRPFLATQACSKHRMTVGEGGSERVAHNNSLPPLRFGPSVKEYCLVHVRSLHLSKILFVLASNFPFVLTLTKLGTCLGYRSRKVCQTIAFGFLSPQRSR